MAAALPLSRRTLYLTLLAVTLPAGLVWRLAPLPLSPFAFKYGGSMLWAVAVYWIVAAAFARWTPARIAALATLAAFSVEWLKLWYWPPLDHFRETLPGKLLLGRHFSVGALLAYALAIGLTAVLDTFSLAKTDPAPAPI